MAKLKYILTFFAGALVCYGLIQPVTLRESEKQRTKIAQLQNKLKASQLQSKKIAKSEVQEFNPQTGMLTKKSKFYLSDSEKKNMSRYRS